MCFLLPSLSFLSRAPLSSPRYSMGFHFVTTRYLRAYASRQSTASTSSPLSQYDSIASFFSFFCSHVYFPASGQAVVTGVVPSPPRFLPSIFIAHRVQQSQCSSIFHRVLLTHALALSASQFVRKKKSPRIYTPAYTRPGPNPRNTSLILVPEIA